MRAECLEEIVVTGSYIARPADRPQSVQVLDAQELLDEQKNSFTEIFKDMTIANGGIALLNTENGTSQTTSINLRGVGPRGTLVLLNGKRQTVDGSTGGGGTVAVDINNLTPSIMVERVEILTDGASALYGSDAVVVQGDTLADRLSLALNCQGLATRDVCWNPLGNAHLASPGDPHYNNPELFKWIFAERINSGNGELQIFGATLGRGAQATLGGELIDARAITVGDPNLQPEQADNLTLGFTWDVTDNFTLDVNYWSIDFQNLVVAEDATVLYN